MVTSPACLLKKPYPSTNTAAEPYPELVEGHGSAVSAYSSSKAITQTSQTTL
jgi:hypothetical protein